VSVQGIQVLGGTYEDQMWGWNWSGEAFKDAFADTVIDRPTPSFGPDLDRAPPRRPERTPEELAAADLRRDANEACGRQEWAACSAKLEKAKGLDPAGDGAESVQRDWKRAAAGMKADEEREKRPEKGSGR
jgi:hypothetical protein